MRRGSPLPIPNREVKPACADGTAICGRVCRRLFIGKPVLTNRLSCFLSERRVRLTARFVAFFREPQLEKAGVFVFIGATLSANASSRRLFKKNPVLTNGVFRFCSKLEVRRSTFNIQKDLQC